MAESIVSRELISRQAARAVQIVMAGGAASNPYCVLMEPEHHREWDASFARQMHEARAIDGCEASA